ncbi:UDP-N-acetylglucosamine 1-carboxyvinyltransferase [bacterium]|nr:UDP-N-acetylglucosamine 1-carboxyvinyltransferase [bacterium]
MSDKFIIEGGKKLEGEIEVRGSKNAAGALLAATLLTDKECIIDNLPRVSDILNFLAIIEKMGGKVNWLGTHSVSVKCEDIDPTKIDFQLVSKARLPVLLIGALLSRFRSFRMIRPGGDRIGLRPITTHLKAFRDLGVDVSIKGDFYSFNRKELQGKTIVLSEFSVTATENIMLGVVLLSHQRTIIKGAACEPGVQNLMSILNKMGAKVKLAGQHLFSIEGVDKLQGAREAVIPDRIEAGTFSIAAALCGGKVNIAKIEPNHLDLFWEKLRDIGVRFKIREKGVTIFPSPKFFPVKVQALPYPGFPTDLLPLMIPLLTQAEGRSLIYDPLYENRLNFTQELRKMGADIEIVDPHRAFIFGKSLLCGVRIESWDIRAGASLLLAGLIAQGTTILSRVSQIDRGYEKVEERLQQLGAKIKRVE